MDHEHMGDDLAKVLLTDLIGTKVETAFGATPKPLDIAMDGGTAGEPLDLDVTAGDLPLASTFEFGTVGGMKIKWDVHTEAPGVNGTDVDVNVSSKDVGAVIGNLIMSYLASSGHERSPGDRRACEAWVLETVNPPLAPLWLTALPPTSAQIRSPSAMARESRLSTTTPTPSPRPYPSAAASKVLQRPSGANAPTTPSDPVGASRLP